MVHLTIELDILPSKIKLVLAKMGQLIQSNSALIQAAILLPQTATSGAVKSSSQGTNMDKEQVLRKISDFGSRFGKLEFPPKLVPVPGRFSNCCILIG